MNSLRGICFAFEAKIIKTGRIATRKKKRRKYQGSEGGLSALFARRATIEYRYLQFHKPRLRADAKINEPITEVDTRLVPGCV